MTEIRPEIALNDAELESIFLETTDGKYYRRVKASGVYRAQALTQKLIVDQFEVTDTEQSFPLAGPTDDLINGFTLTNQSETNKIYYSTNSTFRAGWSNNTSDGGKEIGPGESQNIPCAPDLRIYVKCEIGKTAKVEFVQWI